MNLEQIFTLLRSVINLIVRKSLLSSCFTLFNAGNFQNVLAA